MAHHEGRRRRLRQGLADSAERAEPTVQPFGTRVLTSQNVVSDDDVPPPDRVRQRIAEAVNCGGVACREGGTR
jgi:hypothetical protein